MSGIVHSAEWIPVSAMQLTAWRGRRVGSTLRLDGPCPACCHSTTAVVRLTGTAFEGGGVPTVVPSALTVAVSCACGREHAGHPVEPPRGCGRTWTVTAVNDAAGDVVLHPADDPYLAEAADAWRMARTDQLARLQAGAEKWTAGIASLLGLLGVLGIGLQTDRIAGLTDGGKTSVAALIAVVVVLGGFAVVQGYRAAYGWPRSREVTSDQDLISWYSSLRELPFVAAARLRCAVIAAGAALAAVTAATVLPWLLASAAPASPVVKVALTDRSVVCGTLLSSPAAGRLSVRRADSGAVQAVSLNAVARVSPVAKC